MTRLTDCKHGIVEENVESFERQGEFLTDCWVRQLLLIFNFAAGIPVIAAGMTPTIAVERDDP